MPITVHAVDDPGCPTIGAKSFGRAMILRASLVIQHRLQKGNIVGGSLSMTQTSHVVWHIWQSICSASGTLSSWCRVLCAFAAASRSRASVNHWPIGGRGRLRARLLAIAANKPLRNARFLFLSATLEEITSNSGTPTTSSDPQSFSAVQGSDNESGPQV